MTKFRIVMDQAALERFVNSFDQADLQQCLEQELGPPADAAAAARRVEACERIFAYVLEQMMQAKSAEEDD